MACCLTAPSHYPNQCWLHNSSYIHIRAISQEMPQPSITKICLQITYLKSYWNSPGANEFISFDESRFGAVPFHSINNWGYLACPTGRRHSSQNIRTSTKIALIVISHLLSLTNRYHDQTGKTGDKLHINVHRSIKLSIKDPITPLYHWLIYFSMIFDKQANIK